MRFASFPLAPLGVALALLLMAVVLGGPGSYQVEIWLTDDGTEWRSVFAGKVIIADNSVANLFYDGNEDQFKRRE